MLIGLLIWSFDTLRKFMACYSLRSNIQQDHNPLSFELMGINRELLLRMFNVAQRCIKIIYVFLCFAVFLVPNIPAKATQECCLQYQQSCCGPGKCSASAFRTQCTNKRINHESKGVRMAGDIRFVFLVGQKKHM